MKSALSHDTASAPFLSAADGPALQTHAKVPLELWTDPISPDSLIPRPSAGKPVSSRQPTDGEAGLRPISISGFMPFRKCSDTADEMKQLPVLVDPKPLDCRLPL